MNTQKLKATSIIVAIAIASIALIVNLSQTANVQAVDPPKGNNVYVFGEGVNPQATFTFRDTAVTYDFQLFDMTTNLFGTTASGFTTTRGVPEFTLARIVGDTPYLHKAVDQTYENGGKSIQDYQYKVFDVTVNLVQAGEPMKTLEYKDCTISNYKINTRTDNEEGYVTGGKTGFAVVETYSFGCNGLALKSPTYDAMITSQHEAKPYQ
ncbi:MAG: hypothetical protein EB150_07520 [Nitrososphaeria archaeon]|nr:hypothetical protein [Nitrososphaeria archaeon]NDB52002.1 hypothetical protein [Nitrosopumilaceae archaeon]NDB88896.1 hypothetical protein [Nitrososphaerota archaeon]NDB63219.1 hypothetical protein [Nitrosopumilaceae archaeon]NDF27275.1 hypothetical protein [Nitrosopumilaceae archaeon]